MSGPDNSLDFIVDDRQLKDELAGTFGSIADTIVVGRQTFLDMCAYALAEPESRCATPQ